MCLYANDRSSKNVWISVTAEIMRDNKHSEKLRKDYRGAFDEWALQMSRLQAAVEGSDVKETQERAAAAEVAYRDSRDRLTEDMGWNPNISK
jgi:hypothetical protein